MADLKTNRMIDPGPLENQWKKHMLDSRRILSFLLGASLTLAMVRAADIRNGSFAVKDAKTLRVTYRGRKLISGDEINYLSDFSGATTRVERIGDSSVLNVIQNTGDAVHFRKEVALHADGRLELTVKMRLFPYTRTGTNTETQILNICSRDSASSLPSLLTDVTHFLVKAIKIGA